MTLKTPADLALDAADEIRWSSSDDAIVDEMQFREIIERAIDADRAQRETIYIVQDEMGDVIDVTFNREWAKYETRKDDDSPIRSMIVKSAWDGPTADEWEDFA